MFVITAPVCRQGLESICNLILNKKRYSVIPAYAGIHIEKYHTGLSLYSKH